MTSLPTTTPSGPRSSALALTFSTPASGGDRLLGSDGLVLSGGRVASRSCRNLGSLGLGHIDGRGDRNWSDHRRALDPGACLEDRLRGADLRHL